MAKFKVGDRVKVNIRDCFKQGECIGEIVYINNDITSPYLVGVKDSNGHSGYNFGGEKIAKQKGYDKQCWWHEESELELVEEKKMTPLELLLNHWGIEVGENFNIEGERYNPYYFDYDGYLFDCCDDDAQYQFAKLLTGKCKIQKIETREMTIAEIEKELGYAIKVIKED